MATYIYEYGDGGYESEAVDALAAELEITIKDIYTNTHEANLDYFCYLAVILKSGWTSKVKEFPGNCAWLIVYGLPNNIHDLGVLLIAAEQLAVIYEYAGVFLSHSSEWSEDCFELVRKRGYIKLLTQRNAHSGNYVYLYHLDLEE